MGVTTADGWIGLLRKAAYICSPKSPRSEPTIVGEIPVLKNLCNLKHRTEETQLNAILNNFAYAAIHVGLMKIVCMFSKCLGAFSSQLQQGILSYACESIPGITPYQAFLQKMQSKFHDTEQATTFLQELSQDSILSETFNGSKWALSLDIALAITPIALFTTKSFCNVSLDRKYVLEVYFLCFIWFILYILMFYR